MNRRVVLAGWGQITQTKYEPDQRVREPLELMAEASCKAFEMTGSFDAQRNLNGVMVVKVMSRYYDSADRSLIEQMSLSPLI